MKYRQPDDWQSVNKKMIDGWKARLGHQDGDILQEIADEITKRDELIQSARDFLEGLVGSIERLQSSPIDEL